MNAKWTKFAVEGRGEFPFDMLRYDGCFPADTASAGQLPEAEFHTVDGKVKRHRRTIYLMHVGSTPFWEPTYDRWASFGWSVDRDSVTEA